MMFRNILLAFGAMMLIAGARAEEKAGKAAAPVVVLKLDDITLNGASGDRAISPRWQKCIDFIAAEKVKASCGIIGDSLEGNHPAYFAWIKDLNQKGFIEFWNHGYENKAERFKGTSLEEQFGMLEKTQRLAQEKLGITLRAFGPHWGPTDAATEEALARLPEIKAWFYGPEKPKGGQLSLPRRVNLEQPTFVPNFEKVKTDYERYGHKEPVLALQGHPNQWDEKRFGEFVKVVRYLKEKGCRFMTVSEYVNLSAPK